jgi:hypothetical protein
MGFWTVALRGEPLSHLHLKKRKKGRRARRTRRATPQQLNKPIYAIGRAAKATGKGVAGVAKAAKRTGKLVKQGWDQEKMNEKARKQASKGSKYKSTGGSKYRSSDSWW